MPTPPTPSRHHAAPPTRWRPAAGSTPRAPPTRAKAELWTHANALCGAPIIAVHEDLQGSDVHLVHLPLFHTTAQAYSVLACLWAGATAVVLPRFSASRFWSVSLKHRCTWVSIIPFCIKALMTHEMPAAHHYRLWGTAACDLPTDPHFRAGSTAGHFDSSSFLGRTAFMPGPAAA